MELVFLGPKPEVLRVDQIGSYLQGAERRRDVQYKPVVRRR
jgi:hypothetical protein